MKGYFKGHLLVAAYQSQMKAKTQLSSELLQGCAAIIEQLAHRSLVKLPESFTQRKEAYAFINE